MRIGLSALAIAAALLLFAGAVAVGQPTLQDQEADQDGAPGSGVRNSLSIQLGYAWGKGEWTDHPYAPVSYFTQNLVIGGDIAFRLSDNLALAIAGFYTNLDTDAWDEYAASMGDAVSSSASMGVVAVVLRPYLRSTAPDLVSVEIGPAMLFAGGSEKFGSRSYDFDFMSSPRFGVLLAIEYDRYVGDNYALYARAAAAFIPSGLQYAHGWSPTVVTVPFTVGARILF